MTHHTEGIPLEDLYTVQGLAAIKPEFLTPEGLTWQLRNRATNGLAPAVVKVGKKLLISKSRYEQWLATQACAVSEGVPA